MADFPASVVSFANIVDGTTYMEATNVNLCYDEVEAVQTFVGSPGSGQTYNKSIVGLLFNYIYNLLTFQNILLVFLLATILIIIVYSLRNQQFIYQYKLNLINSFTERNTVKNILITFIIRISESLSVFFLFKSVGCTISFGLILFGMNLSLVLSIFSFIPGGIGIRDGIQASVYTLSAIPFSLAFSLSIVSRIITILVSIILIFIANFIDFTILSIKENV